MKVKVCGITSLEDARMAVEMGADALGFNFYPPSPRFIEPLEAGRITRFLPPLLTTVGVYVNAGPPGNVSEMARAAGMHVLQLHGDESPEYCKALEGWSLIKALRIGNAGTVPVNLAEYEVHAFLLDARDDALFGGTGKTFDWGAAGSIDRSRPLILAGGLRPENVAAAIRKVHPYAVDVCSGVERSPGRKDADKLSRFMHEVRNASE